jgi:hypothetical protein
MKTQKGSSVISEEYAQVYDAGVPTNMFQGAFLGGCDFTGCTINGKPVTANAEIFRNAVLENTRIEGKVVTDIQIGEGVRLRTIREDIGKITTYSTESDSCFECHHCAECKPKFGPLKRYLIWGIRDMFAARKCALTGKRLYFRRMNKVCENFRRPGK